MVEREALVRPIETVRIEGITPIHQEKLNWYGYVSVAMVMNYYGFQTTPHELFKKIYPDHNDPDTIAGLEGPSIGTLASLATEETNLKAQIFDLKQYALIKERNEKMDTPMKVLKTLLKGKRPCIVRRPNHFVVVTGYDEYPKKEFNTIHAIHPISGENYYQLDEFQSRWAISERNYPDYDTSYLMLVISPKKIKST